MHRRYKNIEKAIYWQLNRGVPVVIKNAKYKLSKTFDLSKFECYNYLIFKAVNCRFMRRKKFAIKKAMINVSYNQCASSVAIGNFKYRIEP